MKELAEKKLKLLDEYCAYLDINLDGGSISGDNSKSLGNQGTDRILDDNTPIFEDKDGAMNESMNGHSGQPSRLKRENPMGSRKTRAVEVDVKNSSDCYRESVKNPNSTITPSRKDSQRTEKGHKYVADGRLLGKRNCEKDELYETLYITVGDLIQEERKRHMLASSISKKNAMGILSKITRAVLRHKHVLEGK